MGNSCLLFLCLSLLFLQCLSLAEVRESEVAPALYTFGDSTVDSGNNNYRKTRAQANYAPYGVDFPVGVTGRFTNGHTISDFIAMALGSKLSLSILDPALQPSDTVEGLNYASGSAGILPETGRALGDNISLKKQIKMFRTTIRKYMPESFKTKKELKTHLSRSIFLIHIGSNDYINNFLQPRLYNSSRHYNANQFAQVLAHQLGTNLKELHGWGARKFLVFQIPPLGCYPTLAKSSKPKTGCDEGVNTLVSIYNKKLARELKRLRSTLKGSTFVMVKSYNLIYDMVKNPAHYGFKDSKNQCCAVGRRGTGRCLPKVTPCQDRKSRLFWDSFHLSEAAQEIMSGSCFYGTGLCSPVNIFQLTQKP